MKHIRGWLIAAAALCVAGALLAGGAFAMVGFDVWQLDATSGEIEEKSYSAPVAGVEEIRLELGNRRVEILPAEGEEIALEYTETKYCKFEISNENGVLRVRTVNTERHYNWLKQVWSGMFSGLSEARTRCVLRVPQGYQKLLSVRTTNGSINCSGIGQLEDLSLDTSNAAIEVENCALPQLKATTTNARIELDDLSVAGTAVLSTTNGSLHLTQVKAGRLEMKTTNSSIDLDSVTASGGLEAETKNGTVKGRALEVGETLWLKTTNGTLTLEDSRARVATVETTNAAVRLERISCDKTFTATTKNGRVEFERMEATTTNFKTTNASVKGSFVGGQGDYNYRCTTTNGKSNLGESGGTGAQKQFYCATTNGNIDISFTQS
ncbi:DUF4097 family beta strand repeat-containing protein [Bittarella massiliensis (ex Durand et al. 2017)]|uniref:DUF4097 family beta strand repeat-containing protein n=1 Tax=Bittarella massiliensis (ex Durand et al. 2017) TaxID=1720313 RepID=UPI001AA12EF1|nr:DUF4097 family beta strand repeat-containing protein [Bittarella massiliensis (ex Durand et al. 2017)]MBO1678358.1 DUF4097 family beta strand repeat protein [Bittarella massiliensis (ex Durand et al. 2017)]